MMKKNRKLKAAPFIDITHHSKPFFVCQGYLLSEAWFMKEIMNEWRVFLREESLNEATAIGAAIGLGRKGTSQAIQVGGKGIGLATSKAVEHIPGLDKVLSSIEESLIKLGMPKGVLDLGINKIFDFFIGLGTEQILKSKKINDFILRFFYYLKTNIPWLYKALPKLIENIPLISIAMDSYTIYEQVMILIEEINRASTLAATEHGKKMTGLLRIREYDNLIKQQGYDSVFGQLDKKQFDSLKLAFNTAKQFAPSVVEFNPTVYKLITDFEKQSAPGQPLQPPETEY